MADEFFFEIENNETKVNFLMILIKEKSILFKDSVITQ